MQRRNDHMHSSRIVAFASLFVAIVAAGCRTGNDEPAELSDPGYLPTGTYSLRIVDASCNVNRTFQSAERVALFRNAAGAKPGVNVPVPTKIALGSQTSVFGTAHQDLDLTTKHVDFVLPDANGCGDVSASIDVTELASTRLALAYREQARETCDVPECSVDYVLDLVEAACPSDCKSTGATLNADASGSMIWRCDCQ